MRTIELQLEQMRRQQAQLEQAYQREVAAQKKEDARAHELMESVTCRADIMPVK